jgi:hypothetical protein
MSTLTTEDTTIAVGDRLLVGHDPATQLRVVDIDERDGRRMASIEAGRFDPVRWQTPAREVVDKLERGRYRRVESC